MTQVDTIRKNPTHARAFTPRGLMTRMVDAMAMIRAARASRAAIEHLSYHSDAQLADIGLHRSELQASRLERVADTKARAIMRLYR